MAAIVREIWLVSLPVRNLDIMACYTLSFIYPQALTEIGHAILGRSPFFLPRKMTARALILARDYACALKEKSSPKHTRKLWSEEETKLSLSSGEKIETIQFELNMCRHLQKKPQTSFYWDVLCVSYGDGCGCGGCEGGVGESLWLIIGILEQRLGFSFIVLTTLSKTKCEFHCVGFNNLCAPPAGFKRS